MATATKTADHFNLEEYRVYQDAALNRDAVHRQLIKAKADLAELLDSEHHQRMIEAAATAAAEAAVEGDTATEAAPVTPPSTFAVAVAKRTVSILEGKLETANAITEQRRLVWAKKACQPLTEEYIALSKNLLATLVKATSFVRAMDVVRDRAHQEFTVSLDGGGRTIFDGKSGHNMGDLIEKILSEWVSPHTVERNDPILVPLMGKDDGTATTAIMRLRTSIVGDNFDHHNGEELEWNAAEAARFAAKGMAKVWPTMTPTTKDNLPK